MAISTHRDLYPGPVAPDMADDVPQDPCRLFPRRPLALTQQRQHRLASRRFEDVDRLEDVLVIMGVEQRQLLAAVDGVRGVVDVEHEAVGNTLEAVTEQVDHRQPHARQRAP